MSIFMSSASPHLLHVFLFGVIVVILCINSSLFHFLGLCISFSLLFELHPLLRSQMTLILRFSMNNFWHIFDKNHGLRPLHGRLCIHLTLNKFFCLSSDEFHLKNFSYRWPFSRIFFQKKINQLSQLFTVHIWDRIMLLTHN